MTILYPFQGKRVELVAQHGGFQLLQPGEYGKWTDGAWYACTPNNEECNLGSHKVVEHEDGTISVSPSIAVSMSRDHGKTFEQLWHGFLKRGVWKLRDDD